jgi:hypothetical protein
MSDPFADFGQLHASLDFLADMVRQQRRDLEANDRALHRQRDALEAASRVAVAVKKLKQVKYTPAENRARVVLERAASNLMRVMEEGRHHG